MTPFDLELCIKDAIDNRGRFVCTPLEFRWRYGDLMLATEEERRELNKYVVLCKDGMIRPR